MPYNSKRQYGEGRSIKYAWEIKKDMISFLLGNHNTGRFITFQYTMMRKLNGFTMSCLVSIWAAGILIVHNFVGLKNKKPFQ